VSKLLRFLWVFPFTIHLAYIAATCQYFPDRIGSDVGHGTSPTFFFGEWLAIVVLSNIAMVVLWVWMPRFNDRILSVPRKEYWLANPERRQTLVLMLQGFMETVMVLLNIFFLGVFQWVYQSNVGMPVVRLPAPAIAVGFISVPLILVVVFMIGLMRNLNTSEE
jgi:hypothetical protein